MVEVARDQRDIDVARLPDRLAVVQRLENCEEPRVLLDLPCDGVEVTGANMTAQPLHDPCATRAAFTAASTSSAEPCAIFAIGWLLAGFSESKNSPRPALATFRR
jgi:hypothetical protein